jgi:acyl phosphate:glycerol-3-phosphate acyltransferase
MLIALGFVLSYLLGAIPTAYIAGRVLKGIDISKHGSGNIGATNTFRVLGKGPGTFVLLFDIAKGFLAVTAVGGLLGIDTLWVLILLGLTAVIGHNWTVFLNFKGGKGIATSFGVLIGLSIKVPPFGLVLLLTFGVWLVLFLIFGFVSLASIFAALVLPVLSLVTNQPIELVFLGVIVCLFVVIRHRSNITRLLSGQETRARFLKRKSS